MTHIRAISGLLFHQSLLMNQCKERLMKRRILPNEESKQKSR